MTFIQYGRTIFGSQETAEHFFVLLERLSDLGLHCENDICMRSEWRRDRDMGYLHNTVPPPPAQILSGHWPDAGYMTAFSLYDATT